MSTTILVTVQLVVSICFLSVVIPAGYLDNPLRQLTKEDVCTTAHGNEIKHHKKRLWVRSSSNSEGFDSGSGALKIQAKGYKRRLWARFVPDKDEENEDSDSESERKLEFELDEDDFTLPPVPLITDPRDIRLNHNLRVNNVVIWDKNPCQWYNHGSGSRKNKKRMKHCRDAVQRLQQAGFNDGDSQLCPKIDTAVCFQFKDHVQSGRCYARVVNTPPATGMRYVLFNDCARDWVRSKNITDSTFFPTATGPGVNSTAPATPEPLPPEPDFIPDGDDFYQQPVLEVTDPSDEVLNEEMVVNGKTIWYVNDCEGYTHDSHSQMNHERNMFCRKEVKRLYDAGFLNSDSKLCPIINGADCFEPRSSDKAARCYAKVSTVPPYTGLKYILLYSCVQDWVRAKNLTSEPPGSTHCLRRPCLETDGDKAYAQPVLQETDPPDEKIDRRLWVNDVEIWPANPCQWYNHGSNSGPNKGRREGCHDAAKNLRKAGFKDGDSKLCPTVDGADCFQFRDHEKAGRCYAKVTTKPPNSGKSYILLDDCVRDWMRGKNITRGTFWPTGIDDSS